MTIKRNKVISILFIFIILSFVSSSCTSDASNRISNETQTERHYLWPGFTMDQAIDASDHIVYGKVIAKKEQVEHKDIDPTETLITNDLTIEVITIIKPGEKISASTETIMYREIPQLSDEVRADIPMNIAADQEVILFLSKHSTVLGPDYVFPVSGGTVEPASYLLDDTTDNLSKEIQVDTFIDMIKGG